MLERTYTATPPHLFPTRPQPPLVSHGGMSTINGETIVLRVLKVNRLREDEDVLEQVGTTTRIYRVNSSLKSDSWSRSSVKGQSKSAVDKIEIPAAAIRYCMRKHAERKSTKGSDPRIATCRGKLQNKRSKLNQEINKELRLRAGAENLYKATTNRKLRETVALELSFVNSNLQLLKEQLAELNSSVEVYQSDSSEPVMPMIPLGLKETKEIDFREPFKDFILEHYSEDGNQYEDAISEFMDIRQAMRTPLRDNSGVSLLFEYYNQLYFVERRFFPPDRSLGIYFEWYDSLTGVPSCQRTVAFEKACVLFNAGALQTQLGAREDRGGNGRGLDRAVDCFLRAAGTFRYLHDHFTNAPSMDLSPNVLQMLVQLMLAQARECLFEKLDLQSKERKLDIDLCLDLAQEAAQVSETYSKVHACISSPPVRDYVPHSWVALALVKREHYAALSHLHVALGVLEALPSVDALTPRTREVLTYIHLEETEDVAEEDEGDTVTLGEESGIGDWARRRRQRKWRRQRRSATGKMGSSDSVLSINSGISRKSAQLDIRVPKDDSERKLLGRAHLREAIMFHEESERLLRMCRELRGKDALRSVLRAAHDRALDAYASAEEEDDFREILDPPRVCPSTKFQLSLTPPDFAQYRVQDLFRELGPVAIFSAKHHWTAPRNVQLRKGGAEGDADVMGDGDAGFGFSVRGDAPVIVAGVDPGSLADFGGMKEGDFIVGIGGKDVKWALHEEVVRLIKAAGRQLSLRIVTPMDRNYLKQHAKGVKNGVHGSVSPNSTTSSASSSSSSGISSGTPSSSLSSSRYNHNSPSSSSSSNASSAGSIASGRAASKSKPSLNGEKSQLPWNPFRKAVALSIGCGGGEKKSGRHDGEDEDGEEDPNVILR